MSFKRNYFIFSGAITHLILALVFLLAFKHYDLSATQAFHRFFDKLELDTGIIDSLSLSNNFEFPITYSVQPTLTKGPRFLSQTKQFISKEISLSDLPENELANYTPCIKQNLLALTSCGILTKDSLALTQAKNKTLNFNLILPNASGHHANGWQLAFSYDALKHLIEYSPEERVTVENKLTLALKHYLILLNDDDASLWHGRTTLSAQMWLTLLAIDKPEQHLFQNATSHFYSMVDALLLTEAWPEGYNYWINSRAFYVVLALSSYLNGTETDNWHKKIIKLLERIGYWHIYATRPDSKIEPLGDEGPRLDLKDETRRVIDIIAQATSNPDFINYSNKLADLHGVESYYQNYRWGWPLFYPAKKNLDKAKVLPLMDTFGVTHFGQSYIRENWLDSATFISFRAGKSFTHHGHYDNGHISVFKGEPLLVNASVQSKYYSKNRLNYSIRTIAKNSILVQRKNEKVDIRTNWNNNISDGGQRVTMPIGSAITTVSDWYKKNNKSPVLAGGEILLIDNAEAYSYIKADLTKAYNSTWFDDNGEQGKLERAERQILYLRSDDTLLIKDTVVTQDKNQVKVIFHTMNKPSVLNETLLKGNLNNGIISSQNKNITVNNKKSFLNIEILTDIADIRLVGGNDYKFYVETDSDDSVLDGTNFKEGLTPQQIKSAPSWRIEVNSKRETKPSIISVHRPSIGFSRNEKTKVIPLSSGGIAYVISDIAVIYSSLGLTNKYFNHEDIAELEGKNILVCGNESKGQAACSIINIEIPR